jgi:hypothetical protein
VVATKWLASKYVPSLSEIGLFLVQSKLNPPAGKAKSLWYSSASGNTAKRKVPCSNYGVECRDNQHLGRDRLLAALSSRDPVRGSLAKVWRVFGVG